MKRSKHTRQTPDEPQTPTPESRYHVAHYGKSRNFAAYEGPTLIAVTLYRKGAEEITARLTEKDRRIADLQSQLAAAAAQTTIPPSPAFCRGSASPGMESAPTACPYRRRGHTCLPHEFPPPYTAIPATSAAPILSRLRRCFAYGSGKPSCHFSKTIAVVPSELQWQCQDECNGNRSVTIQASVSHPQEKLQGSIPTLR